MCQLHTTATKKGIRTDKNSVWALLREGHKRCVNILAGADFEDFDI